MQAAIKAAKKADVEMKELGKAVWPEHKSKTTRNSNAESKPKSVRKCELTELKLSPSLSPTHAWTNPNPNPNPSPNPNPNSIPGSTLKKLF